MREQVPKAARRDSMEAGRKSNLEKKEKGGDRKVAGKGKNCWRLIKDGF